VLPALQIGHWFGLSHTWAQTTTAPTSASCAASADYTNFANVLNGNADAVRDTPAQATDPANTNLPVFFTCTSPTSFFAPTQVCNTASGFPAGNNFFGNGANFMVRGKGGSGRV
jgi:hypothetical protein